MKKLMSIGVLLLIFSTGVQASPTFYSDSYVVDTPIMQLFSGQSISATWPHVNPFVGDYEAAVLAGEITVSLTITTEFLDPADDNVGVTFTDKHGTDWLLPGVLNGGAGLVDTTYSLDPDWLNGVEVLAALTWTGDGDFFWADDVVIRTSTLTVAWDPDSGDPAHTPAPGALLLGSMGIGIVGWLRRRRAL